MRDVDYTDLYTRLVTAMDAGAPRGWEHLELTVRVLGTSMQEQQYAVYADGQRTWCSMPTTASYDPVMELREALYERGKGAWAAMVATFSAEGSFHADLDYDHEPAWGIDLPDQVFAEDVARFPREPQATPPWLAQRLGRAAQQQ